MANSVSGVSNPQHAAQVAHASQATQPPKPAANDKTAAPQDTVNISAAAKAASQGQPPKASGDVDHDGDNH